VVEIMFEKKTKIVHYSNAYISSYNYNFENGALI